MALQNNKDLLMQQVESLRYLVLTDEKQIEPCQRLVGARYIVTTLHKARTNGIRAKMDGNEVLLWPSATPQAIELARAFAMELVEDCSKVKFIDSSLPTGDFMTPEFMMGGDKPWTFEALKLWLYGEADGTLRIQEITKPINSESPDAASLSDPNERSTDAEPAMGMALDDSGPMPDELPIEAYANEYAPEHVETRISYEEKPHALGDPGWPDPADLNKSTHRGLPMPLNLVPAVLQPFVEDCRRRLGTPAGPVWFGLLGAISGLAPDHVRLQPKQRDTDWTVHPVVWPLVIGGPSSGKSPAIEIGMKWVQKKDAEAVVENVRKLKEHEHQMNIYADECAAARKNKLPLPPLKREQEDPILREYWVSRGTTEGVTRLLQHSPKVVWYADEASSLINSMDRYSSGGKGSGDREFVLQLYNGGFGKNTLAGKTISLKNASAVLCGGTTPSAMLSAAGGKLQRDGLLARMLFCMVPDMEQGEDTIPDASAASLYSTVLDNLLNMTVPATIKLDPDASDIYRQFCSDLNDRIKSEDSEYLAGTLGKWYGAWGRLALIYWLTEKAAYGQIPFDGDQIGPEIALQITEFMWWQLTHQQQFWYEIMSEKSGRSFSHIIARFILAHPELPQIKFRDHIAGPHHDAMEKLKPLEIKDAINSLISAAWIAPLGPKLNTHGVPTAYEVNPKLKDMFTDEREDEMFRRSSEAKKWRDKRTKSEG